ncbi:MAG: hypothetical protein JO346_00855 [Alphaproteobacteria bacterium]|nr:hypothetical protein [Alphaproteobacteria bacterium]
MKHFKRQYVVRWDEEVRRFHVMLGKASIGFHAAKEGANQLAAAHARQVTLRSAYSHAFEVIFEDA